MGPLDRKSKAHYERSRNFIGQKQALKTAWPEGRTRLPLTFHNGFPKKHTSTALLNLQHTDPIQCSPESKALISTTAPVIMYH